MWAAGASAVVLFALSACSAAPAPAVTAPSHGHTPCHDPFVADIDTSVPGETTPEAAAVTWAQSKSSLTPAGAPTMGWRSTDELTVQSGDWVVGVSQTISGGWVVSGLGCGATQS